MAEACTLHIVEATSTTSSGRSFHTSYPKRVHLPVVEAAVTPNNAVTNKTRRTTDKSRHVTTKWCLTTAIPSTQGDSDMTPEAR